MRILIFAAVFTGLIAAGAGPARADIEWIESDTDTLGATIITHDSAFQDTMYTSGDPVMLTVNWTLDAGAATFAGFETRGNKYTPKSKKGPATGTEVTVMSFVDASVPGTTGSVTVEFTFNDLHPVDKGEKGKGTAHLVLLLNVDMDGDDEVETLAKFGVNVHVTQQP